MTSQLVLRRYKPTGAYKSSANRKLDIHNDIFEKQPSNSNSVKK